MVKRDLKRKRGEAQKDAEDAAGSFFVDCQYKNELPLPQVPKVVSALPNLDELCAYQPNSLELKLRPFLFSNQGLLSRVEIDSDEVYGEAADPSSMAPPAPPIDGQLLKDDDLPAEEREKAKKRAKLTEQTEAYHRQAFGLQMTQLITNDVFTERQRYTTGRNAAEKKIFRNPPGFKSKEELAQKIGKTFQAAKEVPVHPTKPHLRPKRVMQVVPDMNIWENRRLGVRVFEWSRRTAQRGAIRGEPKRPDSSKVRPGGLRRSAPGPCGAAKGHPAEVIAGSEDDLLQPFRTARRRRRCL
ncbi:unnamed protein product [Effrenium voratum]|uniref:Uncharacterized protein n=1 Tax=Effrenium voratum TaxID=2562239 RepID=A0AA36MN69_9DINO|nr:unnamed protein product [Effrenium voratum]CAJ1435759.1 unnamed protein product [Effrenium voratum]